MTQESCDAICDVLKKYFTKVGSTVIKEKADLENLVRKKPDLVFSGIKYVGFTKDAVRRDSPDKIWFSEYLESKGINHTASKSSAIKLEFDKISAKKVMQKNNINTAPFFIAKPGEFKKNQKLPIPYPLFIKPIYEGNGKGIDQRSIVTNFEDFEGKVAYIFREFRSPSLVEKYLGGREFTVGIFDGTSHEGMIAMPVELLADADNRGYKILSFEAKKSDKERLVPVQDPVDHERISKFAKSAFVALGARAYGRIDIRMDENNELYFLEANLMPGLNPHKSYFIKTCKRNKLTDFDGAILKIAEIALKRNH